MDFNVKEEDMCWLKRCYIGYVHNPDVVCLLQDRLIDEGVSNFTVKSMGGRHGVDKTGGGGRRFRGVCERV